MLQLSNIHVYQPRQRQQQRQQHLQRIGYLPLLTQLTKLQLDLSLLPEGRSGVFSRLQQLYIQKRILRYTALHACTVHQKVLTGMPSSL
jgi:hypothetical protein